MTPPKVSRIPAAKDGLLALLEARPALDKVQRSYTHPGRNIAHRAIYLDDVTDSQRDVALGGQPREEVFELRAVVSLVCQGVTPEAAERDLFDVVAEVEKAVGEDRSLNGAILVAGVTGIEAHLVREAQRIVAEAVVTVQCQARL